MFITLAIPSLMRTKVPWYLNTFYPIFAVGIALTLRHASSAAGAAWTSWRWRITVIVFVLALGVAEGKLLWYSFHKRDIHRSGQSLMFHERHRLRGQRLYLVPYNRANHFVADAVIGAAPQAVEDLPGFLRDSRTGDFVLTREPCRTPETVEVWSEASQFLCRRQ
jgi:hypothetical protein